MKTQSYVKIIQKGFISSELELEKALMYDTMLRLMIKENPELTADRNQLRSIIKEYEKANWSSDTIISEKQIAESDFAEITVEREQLFLNKRKETIKKKLTELGMNQLDLGIILGHSKSYISELMNGISPFTLKDLIVIHNLFEIKLEHLISTTIPQKEGLRIKFLLSKLNRPKVKLEKIKLELV
ncbi:MAG: helix-turn-helix transcriptional regulator [Flavobacterium sp.]|nr:helix-turn-helix transcriptional regulator [Flavobacterium sp.]